MRKAAIRRSNSVAYEISRTASKAGGRAFESRPDRARAASVVATGPARYVPSGQVAPRRYMRCAPGYESAAAGAADRIVRRHTPVQSRCEQPESSTTVVADLGHRADQGVALTYPATRRPGHDDPVALSVLRNRASAYATPSRQAKAPTTQRARTMSSIVLPLKAEKAPRPGSPGSGPLGTGSPWRS